MGFAGTLKICVLLAALLVAAGDAYWCRAAAECDVRCVQCERSCAECSRCPNGCRCDEGTADSCLCKGASLKQADGQRLYRAVVAVAYPATLTDGSMLPAAPLAECHGGVAAAVRSGRTLRHLVSSLLN